MNFDELPELELLFDEESMRLYWTTKEGTTLFIEDMATKHINNIMRASLDGRINISELTQYRLEIEMSIRRRLNT